jgi:hypothetical protein
MPPLTAGKAIAATAKPAHAVRKKRFIVEPPEDFGPKKLVHRLANLHIRCLIRSVTLKSHKAKMLAKSNA